MSPLANLAQIKVARFLINSDAANLLVVSTVFALAESARRNSVLRRPGKRKHINGLRYGANLRLLIPPSCNKGYAARCSCAAPRLFGAVFNDLPVPFKLEHATSSTTPLAQTSYGPGSRVGLLGCSERGSARWMPQSTTPVLISLSQPLSKELLPCAPQ